MSNNNTMSFDDFLAEVKERLQQLYPECQIEVATAVKNNDCQRTGIAIKSKETNIEPQIYLDSFYEDYQNMQSIESVVRQVQKTYEEYRAITKFDTDSILNFDTIKHKICYKLINAERSKELLQQLPHRIFQDLAVIYYIPVSIWEEYDSSLIIHYEQMEHWHATEETLYKYAKKNTAELFKPSIAPLSSTLKEMGYDVPRLNEFDAPLYIARYSSNTGGAAIMLCKDVLQDFADTHDDFYILPSSIYELLFLPVYAVDPERDNLSEIVHEVNSTTVLPEDQLSDHVYYYHADTGILEICE